jgi:hypothetical protein
MLQQTLPRVNWNSRNPEAFGPDYVCTDCGRPSSVCICAGGRRHIPTAQHNAAAVAHGLGSNPAKMAGRRTARIMSNAWEHAVKYFGRTAEEVAQIQTTEAEKVDRREESNQVRWAEIEAGKAAFLAGIAIDDAILTKSGRIGWKAAQRDYHNGYRFFDSGQKFDAPNRAMQAGWEAARMDTALAGMVTL